MATTYTSEDLLGYYSQDIIDKYGDENGLLTLSDESYFVFEEYTNEDTGTVGVKITSLQGDGQTADVIIVPPHLTLDGQSIPIIGIENPVFGNIDTFSCNASTIILPNTIEVLLDQVFYSTNASTVEIGHLTSLTEISSSLFGIAYNLKSIDIPYNVMTIGSQAFFSCSLLESVNRINNPDGSNELCAIYDEAFQGCNSLSSFDPSGIGNFGHSCFADCGFESIIIPDGMETISDFMFNGCTKLKTVNIESSSISYIGECAFQNTALESFDLQNTAIVDNVHIGAGCFANCNSLNRLILPNICKIPDSFCMNCTNLSYISTPGIYSSIGESAFENCILLDGVDISLGFTEDGIKSIGNRAFANCASLQTIGFYDLDGEGTENNTFKIGVSAFSNCKSLEEVYITSDLEEGDTNCTCYINDYAFIGCSNLNVFNTVAISHIGEAAFRQCHKLSSIDAYIISDSIGKEAFYESGLNYFELTDNITSIGDNAFTGCSQLESIHIPKNIISLGNGVFNGCVNLTEATGFEGITEIPEKTFRGCSSLTNFSIHDNITFIGEESFYNCGLTSIELNDNSINVVGDRAFYGNNLTSINLGNISYIGTEIVDNCSSLKTMIVGEGANLGSWGQQITGIHEDFVIYCDKDSSAHEYAESVGHNYKLFNKYYSNEWFDYEFSVDYPDESNVCVHIRTFSEEGRNNISTISELTIPEEIEGSPVKHIHNLFYFIDDDYEYDRTSIKSVIIPDYVESMNFCFNDLPNLASVTLPNSPYQMGECFWCCSSLENVHLTGEGRISNSFEQCENLTNLIVDPDVDIMVDCFEYCPSLVNIDFTTNHYSSLGGSFNKIGASSITIPDSFKSIGDSGEYTTYAGCFNDCPNLTTVKIEDGPISIAESFNNCPLLTSVLMPASITTITESFSNPSDNFTIKCYNESYAEKYAIENNIKYEFIGGEDMLPSFTATARIPVRPLNYNNKDAAKKKELLADYKEGKLFISKEDGEIVEISADVSAELIKEIIQSENVSELVITDKDIQVNITNADGEVTDTKTLSEDLKDIRDILHTFNILIDNEEDDTEYVIEKSHLPEIEVSDLPNIPIDILDLTNDTDKDNPYKIPTKSQMDTIDGKANVTIFNAVIPPIAIPDGWSQCIQSISIEGMVDAPAIVDIDFSRADINTDDALNSYSNILNQFSNIVRIQTDDNKILVHCIGSTTIDIPITIALISPVKTINQETDTTETE